MFFIFPRTQIHCTFKNSKKSKRLTKLFQYFIFFKSRLEFFLNPKTLRNVAVVKSSKTQLTIFCVSLVLKTDFIFQNIPEAPSKFFHIQKPWKIQKLQKIWETWILFLKILSNYKTDLKFSNYKTWRELTMSLKVL